MFESKINRGRANGYAPLDGSGKVPLDKLSFNIGSYATTGSNSFFGNQTISGSLILKDGNVVNPTYTAWPYNIVDGNTGEIYFAYSDNPNLNLLFGEGDILIETDNSNRTTPIISITGDGSYWTVMADNSWLQGLTSNSITFSRIGGTWNFGKDGIRTLNNRIAEIYADDDNGAVRIGTAGPNVAPNAQIILGGPNNVFKIKSGPPLREWTFNGDGSLRTPGDIILSGSFAQQVNYAPFGSGSFDGTNTITQLDITKDIHLIDITDKNDDSHFYLPNGLYDGQVVRFALTGNNTNGPNSVYIWMDNLRTYNGTIQSNINWSPFYCGEGQGPCRSLATALFIDGAWNIDTDWWDMW